MSDKPLHPSFLALDRMALGLGDDEALRRHVASCPRCEAHLAELRRGPLHPRKERSSLAREARWRIGGAKLSRWGVGAAAAMAVAAALVLSVMPSSDRSASSGFATRRGAPAVALYIKRGSRVVLWDGTQALRPHDRMRIEVSPDGFTHVGVFSGADVDAARLLYSGPIAPQGASMLPRAWEVDSALEAEVLHVVLAQRPVDATLLGSGVDGDVWVRTLALDKEPAP